MIERHVYVDFDYSGGVPDFTQSYDNITAYVKDIDVNISGKRPVADVSTASIKLNNTNNYFSIGNTASPIYGKYKAELPIKVTAYDSAGTLFTLFYGYTEGLTLEGVPYSSATLECVNVLGILRNTYPAIPIQNNKRSDEIIQFILNYALRSTNGYNYILLSDLVTPEGETITLNGDVYTAKGNVTSNNRFNGTSGIISSELFTTVPQLVLDNFADAVNQTSGLSGTGRSIYSNTIYTRTDVQAIVPDDNIFRGLYLQDFGDPAANWRSIRSVPPMEASRLINDSGAALTTSLVGGDQYQTIYGDMRRSAHADGDSWSIDFEIPIAATYDIGGMFYAFSSAGILDLYVDGVFQNSTDLYDASATGIPTKVFASVSLGIGTHRVTYKTNGKNVSSASYAVIAVKFCIFTGIVILRAKASGSASAAYTLSTSAWDSKVSLLGATFTVNNAYYGNEPEGLLALSTGKYTATSAGDKWGSRVNALTTISDVVRSEMGSWLWVEPDGTVTFKNKDYFQSLHVNSVLLHANNQANLKSAIHGNDLINRATIQYQPRSGLISGTLADARPHWITVPRTSGVIRTDANDPLPNVNTGFIRLPALDPVTKQPIGVSSVIQPILGSDYNIVDSGRRGTGDDLSTNVLIANKINNSITGVTVSVAINGADFEVCVKNTNEFRIYITDLIIRGTGIVSYNSITLALDATASTLKSIRTRNEIIPLNVDPDVAYDYLQYLINRYSIAEELITTVDYGAKDFLNGISLLSLGIGDVKKVSDTQLFIDSLLYVITGLRYRLNEGGSFSLIASVEKLTSDLYLILDNTTYGKLDTGKLGY